MGVHDKVSDITDNDLVERVGGHGVQFQPPEDGIITGKTVALVVEEGPNSLVSQTTFVEL